MPLEEHGTFHRRARRGVSGSRRRDAEKANGGSRLNVRVRSSAPGVRAELQGRLHTGL